MIKYFNIKMTKVYAQKNKDGEWASVPVFVAVKGFSERGYEVIPYLFEDMDKIPITREDIVVGGIQCIRKALNAFGVDPITYSIPNDNLLKYCNRAFKIITIEELNKIVCSGSFKKFFVKPYKEHKLFNGHVVSEYKDLFKTMHVSKQHEIVYSDYVDFVSEYRIFLTHGEIVGMSHYHGDPLVFPDSDTVKSLTKDAYNTYNLDGFSVDVGITSDNQTLLIEINDGFSLGAYGLNYYIYSHLIEARWKQLIADK